MSSATDPSLPQVLTAASVPGLTAGFDAGDVLECYLLERPSALHSLANSTIPIRKLALGLRYRPLSESDLKRLELVLEYGPMRAGPTLNHDVIPRIVEDVEDGSYVTWENEARVYFTMSISSSVYTSANYIASMTGAVLQNLLTTAVAYPSGSHRRYQPLAVYTADDTLLLKSSSDVDFIEALWQHLAEVGVELLPVIRPMRYRLRLVADAIGKVDAGGYATKSLQRSVVGFYQSLYQCLESLATANYIAGGAATKPPTIMPSASPASVPPTRLPQPKAMDTEGPTDSPVIDPSVGDDDDDTDDYVAEDDAGSHENDGGGDDEYQDGEGPPWLRRYLVEETNVTTTPALSNDTTSDSNETDTSSTPEQTAKDAQQAADEAQSAADEAQQSGNEQAASAAQKAATAAKKAADSTASQAAAMAQTSILSGDGASMVSTMASLCLSSSSSFPLAMDDNITTVYLYFDGTFYYQVNLTAPYMLVVPTTDALPRPPTADPFSGGGDFVDWSLAMVVLAFSVVGVLLLLQQVMGRSIKAIRPLYKFQRQLFDPLNHRHDAEGMDDSLSGSHRGKGFRYTFAEDVIPLSMGGRRSQVTNHNEEWFHDESLEHSEPGTFGDMELVSPHARTPKSNNGSLHRSLEDMDSPLATLELTPPPRFLRDPDLVELPNTKSSSKVAMPVSASCNSSNHSRQSPMDFFDDD